jgi:hypothetical protein
VERAVRPREATDLFGAGADVDQRLDGIVLSRQERLLVEFPADRCDALGGALEDSLEGRPRVNPFGYLLAVEVLREVDRTALDAVDGRGGVAHVDRIHPGEGRRTPGGRQRELDVDPRRVDLEAVDVVEFEHRLVEFGVDDPIEAPADRRASAAVRGVPVHVVRASAHQSSAAARRSGREVSVVHVSPVADGFDDQDVLIPVPGDNRPVVAGSEFVVRVIR